MSRFSKQPLSHFFESNFFAIEQNTCAVNFCSKHRSQDKSDHQRKHRN